MKYVKTFESYVNGDYSLYDNTDFIKLLEGEFEKEGSSFVCTYIASAVKMLEGDKVKIYGFNQIQNPGAKYFQDPDVDEEEGHHFAVAEDRYIIDPWIYNNYKEYPETFGKSVFDINNPSDEDEISYIYGDKSCWVDISSEVKPFEILFPSIAVKLKEFRRV